MIQTTVEVGGMACSMCEAHINDTVRNAFPVDKVSSSHSKGKTVILSKEPLDENALRATIEATGYHVGEIHSTPYEKKGLFSRSHQPRSAYFFRYSRGVMPKCALNARLK